jgi:hypothetical protein
MAARDLELLRRYAPQQFQIASWSAEAYLLLILEQKVSTKIDNFINRRARYDKTAKSKDVIIAAKDKRIARLEEENRKLKAELETLRGMVYAKKDTSSGTCTRCKKEQ